MTYTDSSGYPGLSVICAFSMQRAVEYCFSENAGVSGG